VSNDGEGFDPKRSEVTVKNASGNLAVFSGIRLDGIGSTEQPRPFSVVNKVRPQSSSYGEDIGRENSITSSNNQDIYIRPQTESRGKSAPSSTKKPTNLFEEIPGESSLFALSTSQEDKRGNFEDFNNDPDQQVSAWISEIENNPSFQPDSQLKFEGNSRVLIADIISSFAEDE
jgi:hypothetical protein